MILLFVVFMPKPPLNPAMQKPQVKRLVIPSAGTTSLNPFPDGGRYQATSYSVAYPKGSQNSLYTFPGGTTFLTEPPGYPGQPIFDVEAYNSAQNLARKQVLYLAEGAKKTILVSNNNSLPELTNTYKTRVINSQPVHTPTQLRLAYLVKPNAFFVFRMYYSSATSVPADEELFSQFINSFSSGEK